ncbi:MAG: M28 family peptidase, partial [Bryobacteraceae bacterium]
GDRIYNGAVDNATGCGVLVELAHAWSMLPQKPRRSAIFLAVTAEEAGLKGSQYYAEHPFIPLAKTAANINYDALFPYGRTKDIGAPSVERTTLLPLVEEAAKRFQMRVTGDPRPEDGGYYRSDHFSFAHGGVPAFSVESGQDFYGKPAGWGEKMAAEYNAKNYHQPSDEYREDWDFSGLEQYAKFGFVLGINIANDRNLPTWQPGDEFLAARQKSLGAGTGSKD